MLANKVTPIVGITMFIREFRELVNRRRTAETARMGAFFNDYRLTMESASKRFNLLDITGVGNDEVQHSSILAWLLTPEASHACGTVFLQLFLEVCGISIPKELLRGCHVRKEFIGNEAIIDILIYKAGRFLVYVENKTVSAEGVDQIGREYRDMLRVGTSVRVPPDKMYPIFLTPRGRPPKSGDPRPWHPISYGDLGKAFLGALPSLHGRKVFFLLEDLIEQYKRWSGT